MIARDLRNFRFTIEEYLSEKKEVVKRAMSLLPVGKYREEDISLYLSCVFRKMKQDSVAWNVVQLPFKSGDSISCRKNGLDISASVHFTPKTVTVELIDSGKKQSASSSLMSLAPIIFTEEPYQGSFANSLAISTAKSLLLELMYPENS